MMPPDDTLSMTLPPRLEAVLEVIQAVEGHLNAHGISLDARYLLTVAVESVLHERIAHGFDGETAACIEVQIVCDDARIRCEIIDKGQAFEHTADQGPIAEALKEPRIELVSTFDAGENRTAITYHCHRTGLHML